MSLTRKQVLAELDRKNAEMLVRFSREAEPETLMRTGATPAGDAARLRGIPAIGRNVGGAIPGTRP